MTFAGNWPIYARPEFWRHWTSWRSASFKLDMCLCKVLENAGHGYVVFYMVYITFVVFAALILACGC